MNYQKTAPLLANETTESRHLVITKIGTILQTIKVKNNLTFKSDNCDRVPIS